MCVLHDTKIQPKQALSCLCVQHIAVSSSASYPHVSELQQLYYLGDLKCWEVALNLGIVRLGVKPAPTSHMLKSEVSGRSQLDGSHTPFKMWSDWLFLCIKGIVMHCSVDSLSPETFSSVLPCHSVLLVLSL